MKMDRWSCSIKLMFSTCDAAISDKVEDVHLVLDPWMRESRGFGFVKMSIVEEADPCIKYLNRSVLEGRVITVKKVWECLLGVNLADEVNSTSYNPEELASQITSQSDTVKRIGLSHIVSTLPGKPVFGNTTSKCILRCIGFKLQS